MADVPGLYAQNGYVVHDLDRTVSHWAAALGAGPFYRLDVTADDRIYRGKTGRDTYAIAIGFLGATNIELMQPTNDEPSILREVIDTVGEGLHHICPRIAPTTPAEFDELSLRYHTLGLEAVMTMKFMGTARLAMYDTRDSVGSFSEITELSPEFMPAMDLMYEEHLGWDGTGALRSFEELAAKLA